MAALQHWHMETPRRAIIKKKKKSRFSKNGQYKIMKQQLKFAWLWSNTGLKMFTVTPSTKFTLKMLFMRFKQSKHTFLLKHNGKSHTEFHYFHLLVLEQQIANLDKEHISQRGRQASPFNKLHWSGVSNKGRTETVSSHHLPLKPSGYNAIPVHCAFLTLLHTLKMKRLPCLWIQINVDLHKMYWICWN